MWRAGDDTRRLWDDTRLEIAIVHRCHIVNNATKQPNAALKKKTYLLISSFQKIISEISTILNCIDWAYFCLEKQ